MTKRLTFLILTPVTIVLFGLIGICFRKSDRESKDSLYIALILGVRSYLADHETSVTGRGPSLDEIRNYLEEPDYSRLKSNRDVIYTYDNLRVQIFSPGLIAFDRRKSPALCIFLDGHLASWDAILMDVSNEKSFSLDNSP
jgi:hypothetical protein